MEADSGSCGGLPEACNTQHCNDGRGGKRQRGDGEGRKGEDMVVELPVPVRVRGPGPVPVVVPVSMMVGDAVAEGSPAGGAKGKKMVTEPINHKMPRTVDESASGYWEQSKEAQLKEAGGAMAGGAMAGGAMAGGEMTGGVLAGDVMAG